MDDDDVDDRGAGGRAVSHLLVQLVENQIAPGKSGVPVAASTSGPGGAIGSSGCAPITIDSPSRAGKGPPARRMANTSSP